MLGIDEIIARIPEADRYYFTLDADGLDPSIAPGVFGPLAPGGITYYQVLRLMFGIANKGKIVGFDFVEVFPTLDIKDITSLVGARIILNLIGVLAHSGQIGGRSDL
jgi:agmatinase